MTHDKYVQSVTVRTCDDDDDDDETAQTAGRAVLPVHHHNPQSYIITNLIMTIRLISAVYWPGYRAWMLPACGAVLMSASSIVDSECWWENHYETDLLFESCSCHMMLARNVWWSCWWRSSGVQLDPWSQFTATNDDAHRLVQGWPSKRYKLKLNFSLYFCICSYTMVGRNWIRAKCDVDMKEQIYQCTIIMFSYDTWRNCACDCAVRVLSKPGVMINPVQRQTFWVLWTEGKK